MVLGVVTVLMGVAVLITHFFARSHVLRVINSSVAVVFISVVNIDTILFQENNTL